MKHALAVTIATLGVFAFMALLIRDGTLTFGERGDPAYVLRITGVKIHCPSATDGITAEPVELRQSFAERCDGKAACDLDMAFMYKGVDATCTEEIAVKYECTPPAEVAARTITAYLYEGQRGSLLCDTIRP